MTPYDHEALLGRAAPRFSPGARVRRPPHRAWYWWVLIVGGVLLAAGIVLAEALLIAAGLVLGGVAGHLLDPARRRPRSAGRSRLGLVQFGGELRAGEQRQVGQPQPDQKDHGPGERAVKTAVGAQSGGIQGEGTRGGEP